MSDSENHTYTRKLDDILAEIKSQRSTTCGATPDVVREHTAMLHEMRSDLKNINANLVSLADKFDSHVDDIYDKVNDQGTEITKLKTEKKTAVSIITATGALIGSAISMILSVKGMK